MKTFLTLFLLLAMPLQAATYYLDINASGGNDGTSWADAWETIADANAALGALGDDGAGDVVEVNDGDYGIYRYTTLETRTAFLTFQAASGASPIFEAIYLEKAGVGVADTWLKFVGFDIDTGLAKGGNGQHRIYLQNAGYVWIEDCTFTGDGYIHAGSDQDGHNGITMASVNDVNVLSCTFTGSVADAGRDNTTGFHKAIALDNDAIPTTATDILISGCTISDCGVGISINGPNTTIDGCTIYNMNDDGILLTKDCSNSIISDNVIYHITPARLTNHSGGATYNDTTGVITADTPGTFRTDTGEIELVGYYLRFTDSGTVYPTTADDGTVTWATQFAGDSAWATVDTSDANTITLDDPIGCGDKASITLIEAYTGRHCDGIQHQGGWPNNDDISYQRNKVYKINRQGFHLAQDRHQGTATWTNGNAVVSLSRDPTSVDTDDYIQLFNATGGDYASKASDSDSSGIFTIVSVDTGADTVTVGSAPTNDGTSELFYIFPSSKDCLIENNLVYECGGVEMQIEYYIDLTYRGNTVSDHNRPATDPSPDYGTTEFKASTDTSLTAYGNITGTWDNDGYEGCTVDNYNLVLTYGSISNRDPNYTSGASTTEYDDNSDGLYTAGELASWKANFTSYDANNFIPAGDALDLFTANYPTDDINGDTRNNPSDAGAYEYVAGEAPSKAISPIPSHNAIGISIAQDLSWVDGGGAENYNVYFGTDSTPDAGELQGNQVGTAFDAGTMSNDTSYYWRIDSNNVVGLTTGDIWSFTTLGITDIEPPNVYRDRFENSYRRNYRSRYK